VKSVLTSFFMCIVTANQLFNVQLVVLMCGWVEEACQRTMDMGLLASSCKASQLLQSAVATCQHRQLNSKKS